VFLANLLEGHDLPVALGRTAASVFAVMEATVEAGTREMRIIASQDTWASPSRTFEVDQIRGT
jgi:pyridoxine kinase